MTRTEPDGELLRATLDIWHPECWGICSTAETGSSLVGHGAAVSGDSAYERCTIYGGSVEHLDQAVAVAHDSPFIRSIHPLDDGPTGAALPAAVGRRARDVFIEYPATDGIGAAFVSRGYVLDGQYRVEDGIETWDLLVHASREAFERSLDEIRDERDADITLERLSPAADATRAGPTGGDDRTLTTRQREVFALARRRGYYEWPREVSARELAAELDVSKTTLLEHLRTAESKLLGGGH
ncbi:helix-turn-helix domain-containing protein [Haloarchaeobius iranensis]|uniref:HTH DNA binding domain-containing protein n=1 Tax=Haloarchaeobius iranensis TaxID=996166 RepID=A0A1G9SCP3_9EURY|nr:helix-turn-helix domain-containing protein [Haloarchaeobius iranensis]SDM33238.1 HTH DNA binding domain-containing protein [Haloarchaeobius iranensis]